MPKRKKASDHRLREARQLVEQIALFYMDGEKLADGASYIQGVEDALETLTSLIRAARCLTGVQPGDLAKHGVVGKIHGRGPAMLQSPVKRQW